MKSFKFKQCQKHNYIYKFVCVDEQCEQMNDVLSCSSCLSKGGKHVNHQIITLDEFEQITGRVKHALNYDVKFVNFHHTIETIRKKLILDITGIVESWKTRISGILKHIQDHYEFKRDIMLFQYARRSNRNLDYLQQDLYQNMTANIYDIYNGCDDYINQTINRIEQGVNNFIQGTEIHHKNLPDSLKPLFIANEGHFVSKTEQQNFQYRGESQEKLQSTQSLATQKVSFDSVKAESEKRELIGFTQSHSARIEEKCHLISMINLSEDFVVALVSDQSVALFNLETRKLKQKLANYIDSDVKTDSDDQLILTSDKKFMLASSYYERSITVYQAVCGQKLRKILTPCLITCISCFSQNLLALAGQGLPQSTIYSFSYSKLEKQICDLQLPEYSESIYEFTDTQHKQYIRVMVKDEEKSSYMFTGSTDGLIGIFDLEQFKFFRELGRHQQSVVTLIFLDQSSLASSGLDNKIKIWDLDNLTLLNILPQGVHMSPVFSVVKIDIDHFASSSYDRSIVLWEWRKNRAKMRVEQSHKISQDYLKIPIFLVNSAAIISSASDKEIQIWEIVYQKNM